MSLTTDQIALLQQPQIAHLATVGPDGRPHVTPVWIDTDGEAVLVNTVKGRVKHRNIVGNPSVCISLVDRDNPYENLVIQGVAELVDEGAEDHIDQLAKQYMGVDEFPLRQPGEQRVIVRVVPT